MRTILVLAALLVSTVPALAQNRGTDETAIRALVTAVEAAVNARDIDRSAALYAPDADVMIVDNPLATGRAEIMAGMASQSRTVSATWRIALGVTGIRFLGPDVAIVNTKAEFNEGPIKQDRGSIVVVRQEGQWLVSAIRVLLAERSQ